MGSGPIGIRLGVCTCLWGADLSFELGDLPDAPTADSCPAVNPHASQQLLVFCGHGLGVRHGALLGGECLAAEEIKEQPEHQAVLVGLALRLVFWLQARQQRGVVQHLQLAGSRRPEELPIRAGVTRYGEAVMAAVRFQTYITLVR